MSYASALLNGVSSDEKPVTTPKAQAPTQPKPQQTKAEAPQSKAAPQESKPEQEAPQPKGVAVQLEGNDGGLLGQLFRDEKEHSAEHQKKAERILSKVLLFANPASISALGRTSQYFLNQILKNKNRELDPLLYKGQKIVKPNISFKVDFIEGKDDSDTKNVTLSYFSENQRRQNALCKYWAKVVLQAQEAREKAGFDPKDIMQEKSLPVKLSGGFFFGGNKHGPLLAQRDLTRTHSWLEACIKLLQGKMRQEVPYLDGGKAILTRYGLGGTKIKVEVVLPAGHAKTEEEKKLAELVPTVHRYEFSEFCLNLRSVAKAFVPLVGTCVVSMKAGIRNVPQEETAAYLEREKLLVNLLKHQTLYNDVKTIKKILVQGVIPGSELPATFRKIREEKLRLKQQQALEYDNIYKFLQNNVPEDFENAKSEAKSINDDILQQKEKEKEARQAAYEERKLGLKKLADSATGEIPLSSSPVSTGSGSEASWAASSKAKKERLKKKIVKETDKDGFTTEKVYIVQNDGELLSAPPKKVKAKTVVKKQTVASSEAFENNLFHVALLETSYISIAEDQHQKTLHKTQSRLEAEGKKKAQQTQKAKENQKKKAQKQQQLQQQQKVAGKQQAKAAAPAPAPATTATTPAAAASTPKATPKAKQQNQPKKKQEKKTKTLQRSKGQQQQKQQEQDTSIPPVAAALAVACLVAFGYVFMFAG